MRYKFLLILLIFINIASYCQDDTYNQAPNDNHSKLRSRATISKHLQYVLYFDSLNRSRDSLFTLDSTIHILDSIALSDRFIDSIQLVNLFHSTNGNSWWNKTNWLSNQPLEKWYGVTTTTSSKYVQVPGVITTLNLQNNNLNGNISFVGNSFKNLSTLNLSSNSISNISFNSNSNPTISAFSKLSYLYSNNLSGYPNFYVGNNCLNSLIVLDFNGTSLSNFAVGDNSLNYINRILNGSAQTLNNYLRFHNVGYFKLGVNSMNNVQNATFTSTALNAFQIGYSCFTAMQTLFLDHNNLKEFSLENSVLQKLEYLSLAYNKLTSFNNAYYPNALTNLITLELNNNQINNVTLLNLNNLQTLGIIGNLIGSGDNTQGTLRTFNWLKNSLFKLENLFLKNSI